MPQLAVFAGAAYLRHPSACSGAYPARPARNKEPIVEWRQRPPSVRKQANLRLETEIKAAHQRTRETYGPKRLQSDLADHGIQASVYRIKRIRTRLGLRCKQKRKFKATTNSSHALPLAPNLLDSDRGC